MKADDETVEVVLCLIDFINECNPSRREYCPPTRRLCDSAITAIHKWMKVNKGGCTSLLVGAVKTGRVFSPEANQ